MERDFLGGVPVLAPGGRASAVLGSRGLPRPRSSVTGLRPAGAGAVRHRALPRGAPGLAAGPLPSSAGGRDLSYPGADGLPGPAWAGDLL